MFQRLLIANRGEIACRIIRTARAMGMRTAAVYSDTDAGAPHVRLADEAHAVGPPPAAESYLRMDAILDAARRAGADAIHPGYGFLSENADFAAACADAGIVFVGPAPDAIRAMGEKDTAKRLMQAADIPVIPGHEGDADDMSALAAAAGRLGYPVLLKAAAGGGGRGMRRVADESELAGASAAARREAAAAFGNDRLLMEKLVAPARHIEVQVFGDGHGNAVHLFERDCSIQRRYQKIIEEAPAPAVTPQQRAALGAAAVRAAAAVNYAGAGTVEFIMNPEGRFWFMEMNTRLQVEHPATEMITGVDLVEWQLRIAAGEPLPLDQSRIAMRGHAIEARLCAEDAARGFLPATGRLVHFHLPQEQAGLVRVDSGIAAGDAVTPHYDSLLAKIIVHGRDRAEAAQRLRQALADTELAGMPSNLGFLRAVSAHPAFLSGEFDTGFIAAHGDGLLPDAGPAPAAALALAALFVLLDRSARARRSAARRWSPWAAGDGWRLNDDPWDTIRISDGGAPVAIPVRAAGTADADMTRFEMTVRDAVLSVAGALETGGRLRAVIDGVRMSAVVVARAHAEGRLLTVMTDGDSRDFVLPDPLAAAAAVDSDGGRLTAPMPGKITRVLCEDGAVVAAGAPLMVLEAMKMEHTINAPAPGCVTRVKFSVGDWVDEGETLLDFTAGEAESPATAPPDGA